MSSVFIDKRRERGMALVHFGISALVAVAGILGYLYSSTLGINYSRERDNIGNTYCIYWMPFTNFENSVADASDQYSCPHLAQPAQTTNPAS